MQASAVMLENKTGTGSGIIFNRRDANGNPRTYVWTAAHVAVQHSVTNRLVAVQEILKQGRSVGVLTNQLKLVKIFSGLDVAVFEAENPFTYEAGAIFALSRPLRAGEEVHHVGSIYGTKAHNSYSRGIVTHARRQSELFQAFVQTDLVLYPGCSGGPVFDRAGRVVGMAVITMAPGVSGFAAIEDWRKVVWEAGLGWLMDASLPMPPVAPVDKSVFSVDIGP
jgi:S1-C subfamily serine protease